MGYFLSFSSRGRNFRNSKRGSNYIRIFLEIRIRIKTFPLIFLCSNWMFSFCPSFPLILCQYPPTSLLNRQSYDLLASKEELVFKGWFESFHSIDFAPGIYLEIFQRIPYIVLFKNVSIVIGLAIVILLSIMIGFWI